MAKQIARLPMTEWGWRSLLLFWTFVMPITQEI